MDDINRRLCELLSCDVPKPKDICPTCGKTNTDGKMRFIDGADFFTERGRIDLLRRMRRSGVWWKFLEVIGSDRRWCEELAGDQKIDMICIDYILDDTGSLARAALEFLEGNISKAGCSSSTSAACPCPTLPMNMKNTVRGSLSGR